MSELLKEYRRIQKDFDGVTLWAADIELLKAEYLRRIVVALEKKEE